MKSMIKVLKLLRKQKSSVKDNFGQNYIKKEVPRTCHSQIFRCNVPYSSEKVYYGCLMVFVPYFDDFYDVPNEHFEIHKESISLLYCVLHEYLLKSKFSLLDSIYNLDAEH